MTGNVPNHPRNRDLNIRGMLILLTESVWSRLNPLHLNLLSNGER